MRLAKDGLVEDDVCCDWDDDGSESTDRVMVRGINFRFFLGSILSLFEKVLNCVEQKSRPYRDGVFVLILVFPLCGQQLLQS